MIISLEDYNNELLHDVSYNQECINLCVNKTGVDDLKYIFSQYLQVISSDDIVGLYQKDFRKTQTESGSYFLLLQKIGKYKLMENIKIKDADINCLIGVVLNGEQISLNFNTKTIDIYNNLNDNSCAIVFCRAYDCQIYNGIVRFNGRSYYMDRASNKTKVSVDDIRYNYNRYSIDILQIGEAVGRFIDNF